MRMKQEGYEADLCDTLGLMECIPPGGLVELSPELIAKLACPQCHGDLVVIREAGGSARAFGCGACKLLYAIEDGIPNFLVPEATPWAGAAERTSP
jgi:uncharacterized protein YbaR (Trm112 family)